MATKDQKRHARGLIEALESRVHAGPPLANGELRSAREFLRQNDFPAASDYYRRLGQIQHRLEVRPAAPALVPAKRNYGGEAGGHWMQLQSAYDHVILSTCYEGEFNLNPGRIKISHRFNQAGRIDFVELKFLRSLHPCLNGEIRTLLRVTDYQSHRKDWLAVEAFVLPVLPRELIFLFPDMFRCLRHEALAWLVNIGHWMTDDLLQDLQTRPPNGSAPPHGRNGDQLCLSAVRGDEVALPILEQAASFECAVELDGPKSARVRYTTKLQSKAC